MSTYVISKNAKGQWPLAHHQPGWITPLGSFPKRKQALLTARVLAGRLSKVEVR
ncbi:hypothetical protein [Rhizobium rhizogenes]|uniref:hypothetical protein n=1 Tax=Rhizobium rhizogenes TaxID=359 RepID=UPI0015748B6F|nr:hypothetical protein [Rhizobium rhizogenes]NTH18468.1 hypothetical protein [Rhizobium rhizogenes]NTH31442.1 hypothetical protein [Rhizobium rhizogenes]